MKEITHDDGRVELDSTEVLAGSPLWNADLSPVPIAERTWRTWDYAALWISMAHCIPTYMLAASLIAAGMSWTQALFTILLGNLIVLAPILLNSHAGTKYGIPFPVLARASYGTIGANLPALLRAVVACGWFGINAWIGGQALHFFFRALAPRWHNLLGEVGGTTTTTWISFLLFWGLNIFVVFRGMDLLRRVERWAAPFVLIMAAGLVVWALNAAGGLGAIVERGGKLGTFDAFFPVFVPALTAMVGFWSTLSVNMPDFTRYGRSQREQAVGQAIALPTTMTLFAAMGVLVTSATVIVYGKEIWDPMELVARFDNKLVVAIAAFTVVVATLSVNIAANVVSPANDFANAFPRHIDFKRGGLLTGLFGILMQPWRLLADPSGYIFNWLLAYSGALGSIAGVMIIDYWVIKRRVLSLPDLYDPNGRYRYSAGWNWPAVIATVIGAGVAIIGRWVPAMSPVYDYAWFVGFGLAAALYYLLSPRRAAPSHHA